MERMTHLRASDMTKTDLTTKIQDLSNFYKNKQKEIITKINSNQTENLKA
jgi:hypothetical protein